LNSLAPIADAVRGEQVFACIVPKSQADTTRANIVPKSQADAALADEIVAWCVDRLAYYEAPGFIAFVAALPLTSTQKIQRGELRTWVRSLVASAHDTRPLKRRPS
jgi:acyl-CoA synthetase (AMP-forming)/AMP-acid ligase II